jgi:hypothetical protein
MLRHDSIENSKSMMSNFNVFQKYLSSILVSIEKSKPMTPQ